jgi:hypothetical protein
VKPLYGGSLLSYWSHYIAAFAKNQCVSDRFLGNFDVHLGAQKVHIFNGKTFWDVEQETEWVDD